MLWFIIAIIICVTIFAMDGIDSATLFFGTIIIFLVALLLNVAFIGHEEVGVKDIYNYELTSDNHVIYKNKVHNITDVRIGDESKLVIETSSDDWLTIFRNTHYIVYFKKDEK